jgi:hypothetical protein
MASSSAPLFFEKWPFHSAKISETILEGKKKKSWEYEVREGGKVQVTGEEGTGDRTRGVGGGGGVVKNERRARGGGGGRKGGIFVQNAERVGCTE